MLVAGGRRKRLFLNELCGEKLFEPSAREGSAAIVFLRRGTTLRYVARMTDGTLEDFASVVPDRQEWFAESLRQARVAVDTKRLRAARLRSRLAETSSTTAALVPAKSWVFSLWAWLVVSIAAVFGRKAPPATTASDELAEAARGDLERMIAEAEAAVLEARAQADRVGVEARVQEDDRRRAFGKAVRALTDADQRGDAVVDLTLEVTQELLPPGVAFVDAPALMKPQSDVGSDQWRRLRDLVGACVVLGDEVPVPLDQALRPIEPFVLPDPEDAGPAADIAFTERIRAELPRIVASVREEAPLAVTALAMADLPSRIHSLAMAAAAGETECRTRIEALERERVPEPETFRAEQMDRLTGAIEDGAKRVLRRALEKLRTRTSELGAEWRAELEACTGRLSLGRAVRKIETDGRARVAALVDDLSDEIGVEMQAASEPLQAWVLEEVRKQYRSKYFGDSDSLVLTDFASDDVAALGAPPLGAALSRFDRRRISRGVGGAVLGAGAFFGAFVATGVTLPGPAPGAEIALGAVVGLCAAFTERARVLKESCRRATDEHLTTIEATIARRLEASSQSFASDIRTAIEDTLESALLRRDEAILRLMDLERETLERENAKLKELVELRGILERQEAAFVTLAESAAAALREVIARRRPGDLPDASTAAKHDET